MAPDVERLVAHLDGLRSGVLGKLAGLSEADARRSTVPSGTNLAGLVQHLTFAESKWFEHDLAGGRARGIRSMTVDPDVTLTDLRKAYRAACERSNAIVATYADSSVEAVRRVLLSMIEETARHAGHADIIREQIDGRTGR